jgi:hypothetical protein
MWKVNMMLNLELQLSIFGGTGKTKLRREFARIVRKPVV